MQPDTPWDRRNCAKLSLGYELLTRRFELVALQTDDIVTRGDSTLRATVRRSKADPFGHGALSFTWRRAAVHVAKWLEWRGPDIAPLFCGIYHEKPIIRALGRLSSSAILKTRRAMVRIAVGYLFFGSGYLKSGEQ